MNPMITQAPPGGSEAVGEVLALLRETGLPEEGVAEHFDNFLIARDGPRLTGCIGMERYGDVALLRSLAVVPDRQRDGLGKMLTARLLEDAQSAGVREVILLTTTAKDFFAHHFGFIPTERTQFDDAFSSSPEWHLPHCSAAVCMHIRLGV
ncbi:MAG TPA: GNAT family N-acetyltransferase [Blastocatellia bacterium]|nr:GNAT family N-acetyltransferase [Blastocatellia bacterium]